LKTPIILVTSDRWSKDIYVVFDDEQILGYCIPDEWINSRFNNVCEYDDKITREQVASEMEDDFRNENTDVDEFWPQYNILRAGSDYYRYTDDGMCSEIDEDEAPELMTDVRDGLFVKSR